MNTDTVTLIERPYQEIVDDIMTAMVGGVVREPIFFDVKEDLYPLSRPASAIRSITGLILAPDGVNTVHYVFQNAVDFAFDAGHNAVAWIKGGQQPADESTFYVDYFRPDSGSPLTDINIGSVTRTVSEAIGREIATVYQQINQAYRAGYVDTATGQALELVVSILDITRKTKDFAVGLVLENVGGIDVPLALVIRLPPHRPRKVLRVVPFGRPGRNEELRHFFLVQIALDRRVGRCA